MNAFASLATRLDGSAQSRKGHLHPKKPKNMKHAFRVTGRNAYNSLEADQQTVGIQGDIPCQIFYCAASIHHMQQVQVFKKNIRCGGIGASFL